MKKTLATLAALLLTGAVALAGPYMTAEQKAQHGKTCASHKEYVLSGGACLLPPPPAKHPAKPERNKHKVVSGAAIDKQFDKARQDKAAAIAERKRIAAEKKARLEARERHIKLSRERAEHNRHVALLDSPLLEDRRRSIFWSERWEDEHQIKQMMEREALRQECEGVDREKVEHIATYGNFISAVPAYAILAKCGEFLQ